MHRTKMFQAASLLIMVSVAGFGCGKKEEAPAKPAAAGGDKMGAKPGDKPATPTDTKTDKPVDPAAAGTPAPGGGVGTISGKVSLDGAAPKMEPLPRQSDPVCAKEPMNSNAVVVDAGGGMKDVLVRLPVGAAKGPAPTAPVLIDQKSCMYTPHVAGIVSGQEISVKNSDGTTHNVHSYVGDETKFNEAQPPGAPDLKKNVEAEGGDVIKLACDVHKWMEAHVVVTDHPFFAVTGADGSFKIENVPAGTYKLEAWQPHLGAAKTVDVTVKPNETAEAKFTFAAADYKP